MVTIDCIRGALNNDDKGEFLSREYVFSILSDGERVGLIEISTDKWMAGDIYVDWIGIDEPYRNMGYGTAAIEALLEQVGPIYLAPTSEAAARLYGRLGEETTKYPELDQNFGVFAIW